MTELSTETYILCNKTIIRGRNFLVQNDRLRKRPGPEIPEGNPKRPVAKRPGCETSRSEIYGWLGRAMVLGSFQCRGVLLLWHMAGACCACSRCGTGGLFFLFFFCCFFFFVCHLSILPSFSNALSLGRRLHILKYYGLGRYYPRVVVSYYRKRAR